jgi:hypothetical protein
MIRVLTQGKDGRPILILGITDRNIEMMRAGRAMVFDATELGFPGTISIISDYDEDAITKGLEEVGLTLKDTKQHPPDTKQHPPVESPDPDLPIPYIVLEPLENLDGIRIRWEKYLPGDLLSLIEMMLTDDIIHKAKTTEDPVAYLQEFVNDILSGLVDSGLLMRNQSFKTERRWDCVW